MLEEQSGGAADKSSVVALPEWQQAQYLTALVSYWLGWNGYYGALLYSDQTAARTDLLEEAAAGFSRASMNFQD